MRLERHVGGLSKVRQQRYLVARGWRLTGEGWRCERHLDLAFKPSRALHHQLTEDLSNGLIALGWKISGYSPRGYVQLRDVDGTLCPLPRALRVQARREKRPVRELTYSLFLAAWVEGEESEGR